MKNTRRVMAECLASVSAIALIAAALPVRAQAAPPGSPQWVQQRAAVRAQAGTVAPSNPVSGITQAQSAQIAEAQRNVGRAADALRAQLAGQSAARALAVASNPAVPDGLATGGLDPDLTAAWTNVEIPTAAGNQRVLNGLTTVTVNQTQKRGIASWNTFNVGANTQLTVSQPGPDSVILNRVTKDTNPSRVLGRITAPGTVMVINRNGIIFAGTAQVNVGGLVASSIDVGLPYQTVAQRNQYFLDAADGKLSFSFNLMRDAAGNIVGRTYNYNLTGSSGSSFVPQGDPVEGSVEVQAGARISTNPLSVSNQYLGRVVLAAPQVTNRGTIETPDGHAILVGARNFTLLSNDQTTINALRNNNPDPSIYGTLGTLSADADLRGAQVLFGLDDYFTTGPEVRNSILKLIGDPANTQVFLAARNATTTGGQAFDGPLATAPVDPGDPAGGRAFFVRNSGVVEAVRGNVTMAAQKIDLQSAPGVAGFGNAAQNGVISVTTAVNANGSVFLKAQSLPSLNATLANQGYQRDGGAIDLAGGAVISLMPDIVGAASGAPATGGDALLGSQPTLPSDAVSASQFRQPVARLEARDSSLPSNTSYAVFAGSASSAGSIVLASGSLIAGPSAKVSLTSTTLSPDPVTGHFVESDAAIQPNIVVRSGAEIDVAGMMDVVLPMSANLVTVPVVGNNDLADQPLQRGGLLYQQSITIDRRASGTRADGTTWYGSPLLNAKGYLDAQGRTASELLTAGGDISFTGITRAEAGSVLNLAGGYTRYLAGSVKTTLVRTADGRVVSMANADPNVRYVGFGDSFVRTHQRWNRTESFAGLRSLFNNQFEAEYIDGARAGSLKFFGAAVVDATIYAGAVAGPYQRKGSGVFATAMPRAGALDLTGLNAVVDFTLYTPSAGEVRASTFTKQQWSTAALETAGFANVSMGGPGSTVTLERDGELTLPPGGTLSLTGQSIDLGGAITAHGGKATLSLSAFRPANYVANAINTLPPRTSLILRPGAAIDLSGLWVNDTGATRDTLAGRDFVDGGSLVIRDGAFTASDIPDFASVVLAAGSTIDLDSGGYVTARGRLDIDSATGLPRGKGGSLSILLHPPVTQPTGDYALLDRGGSGANQQNVPGVINLDPATYRTPVATYRTQYRQLVDDQLRIEATMSAFGFQGGGTFVLRVPELVIRDGSGPIGGDRGRIIVPASFFAEQGFGTYTLTGLLTAAIDPGTTIVLRQRQWLPKTDGAAAASVTDAAVLGFGSGTQRVPANFSLADLGWTDASVIGGGSFDQGAYIGPPSYYADRALIVGPGASIEADPRASATLAAQGQLTVAGSIDAPGGTVTLRQIRGVLADNSIYGNNTLYLDSGASVNVDGTFVADPTKATYRAGKVLPGGSITLAADQFIGMAGSSLSASGTSDVLDLTRTPPTLTAPRRVSVPVGSDAGSMTVRLVNEAEGAFDTSLTARPGAQGNNGGTLSLEGPQITVTSDATTVPAGAAPARSWPTLVPGQAFPASTLLFSTTRLANSGIDALQILPDQSVAGSSDSFVAFSGDVNLSLDRSLKISASGLRWLPRGSYSWSAAALGAALPVAAQAGTVTLSAPYLALARPQNSANRTLTAIPLDAFGQRRGPTLVLSGGSIDISGLAVLDNWGTTRVTTAADMRFTPGTKSNQPDYFATLATAGDLSIRATQVYASSGVSALIQSIATGGRIAIESNGASAPVPLSAASSLLVSAADIVQAGVLRAPLGSIQLGATDAADIPSGNSFAQTTVFTPTTLVTVTGGSLTSVSAAGIVIPYGETQNQKDWLYNGSTVVTPPAKAITFKGAGVDLAPGAVVDISGGGDLEAREFVPGLGGSRNVLQTSLTSDSGATVYAILPGAQQSVAPVDPALTGTGTPSPGATITLLADVPGGGPAAGTYTLLPGAYATLPGAYRVQSAGSSFSDVQLDAAQSQADGSAVVAAVTGTTGKPGSAGGRPTGWSVMSGSVWRRYSEILATRANEFFSRPANFTTVAPRLPRDAGRLVVNVTNQLAVNAQFAFDPDTGGRRGEADITAPRIAVASDGSGIGADYVLLTPAQIRNLNAGSILLGGVRTTETAGTRLNVGASQILVRTSEADPLTGPELLLTATGGITFTPGSVVRAEGETSDDGASTLLIGRVAATGVTAQSGDAALLRVSNAGPVTVSRANLTTTSAGISIGANARLDGGKALTIDAPNQATIDPTAVFVANAVDLASANINFGAPAATAGANISAAQIAALLGVAESVSLRGRTAITFYGPASLSGLQSLTLDTPRLAGSGLAGGTVAIDADTLTFTNTAGAPTGSATAAPGVLELSGGRVVVTGGAKQAAGFNAYLVTATQAISFGDGTTTGSLAVPGSLTLDAPQILAATGSTQTITVTGTGATFTARNSSGGVADASAITDIGGSLAVSAPAISVDTTMAALAGILRLEATATDTGSVVLGANARLLAAGYTQSFLDKDVILSGGSIRLQSGANSPVQVQPGAVIDVSARPGGNAGTLTVVTGGTGSTGANAVLTLGGTVLGAAPAGPGGAQGKGATFILDSAGAVQLDALVGKVMAGGFGERLSVRSGTGNLALNTTIKAHEVALTADGGTLTVGSLIDADGEGGGTIDLYGSTVTLLPGAALLARASDPTRRGGQVNIGAGSTGTLNLQAGSLIDVSGGSPYGSGGGTIHLRVPNANALTATIASTFVRSPVTSAAGAPLTPVILEPYTRQTITGTTLDTTTGTPQNPSLTSRLDGLPSTAALETKYPTLSVQPGLEIISNAGGGLTISGNAIDLSSRRYGANQTPGWLTIRASGNLTIDTSISDGFTTATSAGNVRTVTYAQAMSGALPAGTRSWSYRLAGGARTTSADPLAVITNTAGGGVRFGDTAYNPANTSAPLGKNDILRTGTGSIEIAAAGDVRLLNPASVIYTAGVGVDWATIPGFEDTPAPLPANLQSLWASSSDGVRPVTAGLQGTSPALPTLGGDIRIEAGRDLIGLQNVTDRTGRLTNRTASDGQTTYVGQVFTPWLLFQGAASNSTGLFEDSDDVFDAESTTAKTPARQTASWVVTGTFQQGIAALGGGDVGVRTGGSVNDVSLSVVSTYAVSGGKPANANASGPITLNRFGGGNLSVQAGGDVNSSIFYVGKGQGEIRSGGAMGSSSFTLNFGLTGTQPLASTIGIGDASFDIEARTGVSIGRVLSDSFLPRNERWALDKPSQLAGRRIVPRLSSYGADNVLTAVAVSGDVALNSDLSAPTTYGSRSAFNYPNVNQYLPPKVELVAPRGDVSLSAYDYITLAPSPTGSLDLLAQGSIRYAFRQGSSLTQASAGPNQNTISMLDIDPLLLSNPLRPTNYLTFALTGFGTGYRLDSDNTGVAGLNRNTLHAGLKPLHLQADDPEPVRLIALDGDIVSGRGLATDPVPGAGVGSGAGLFFNKQAEVYAGRDIINMTFTGENNRSSDVTSITAGRDITYALESFSTSTIGSSITLPAGGSYIVGGPGSFVLDGGRDLDLRPSNPNIVAGTSATIPAAQYGVLSVGNRINPYRAPESADLYLLFGTGPGQDIPAFVSRYADPANAAQVPANYADELVAFMNARSLALGGGGLTIDAALAQFAALDEREQLPFVRQVFFDELRSVAPSPDSQFTQNQRRGYEAIATLFPGSLGYTDNLQASPTRVATGDLSMINALVRTDYGGSIAIVGPGGNALVGALTVDETLPLNYFGIFTLRGGAIDVYLDGSLNVNSSRMITAQGGDITIFTANGDIDAGRGKKTATFSPPIKALYAGDTQAFVDFGGIITGSGIGTLVTLPGGAVGNVYLIAPRGTIDAGEAGIRSSGNLVVLAQTVLNAVNIQVGGATVGVPQASTSSSVASTPTNASSQAELGNKAIAEIATAAGGPRQAQQALPSLISVEVLGYGS